MQIDVTGQPVSELLAQVNTRYGSPLFLQDEANSAVLLSPEAYGDLRAAAGRRFEDLCREATATAEANGLTDEILANILA